MAGIWDMITGTNPNQGAINTSTNAANQATNAENQVISSTYVPIIDQMLADWNQYYAQGLGSEASAISGINPNTGTVGSNVSNFFTNEMNQGLTPASIGAAQNAYNTQSQQSLNSEMNQLGPSLPNVGGMAANLGQQNSQGAIGLASNLAGMNQTYQNTGATNAMSTSLGLLNAIMQYVNQGQTSLSGAQSGAGNLMNLYGSSANNAANNATSLANAGNAANSSTLSGLEGLAGALIGAGVFSGSSPGVSSPNYSGDTTIGGYDPYTSAPNAGGI